MVKLGGKAEDIQKYADFRELVARDDLDAVIVGTVDHWHALTSIAAMKYGCDVYCEKPLALTIAEGQAMVKATRKYDRIFQTGNMQRSDARYRLACELVRNGRLGKIHTVEARIGANPEGGPFAVSDAPKDLDWDLWKGPTADVPYVKERCHYEFRWWYEYSGGKLTDWGAHHNDIAQWGLGKDGTGPISVTATGQAPKKDPNSYNCHPHFAVTYEYDDGVRLVTTSDGENGNRFIGDKGWLFVSRERIEASDPSHAQRAARPRRDPALQLAEPHGELPRRGPDPQAADLRRRSGPHLGQRLPPRVDRAPAGYPARLGPQGRAVRRPLRREGERDDRPRVPLAVEAGSLIG